MPVGTRQLGRIAPTPLEKRPYTVARMPEAPPLEDFITTAQNKGQKIKKYEYDASGDTTFFGYIYLMKKYQSRCFISGLLKFYPQGKLKYVVEDTIYNKATEIDRDLADCIRANVETIFIPLEVYLFKEDGKTIDKKNSHANMLIYRPFQKIVERFEPGSPVHPLLDKNLKTLFESLRLGDYTPRYKSPLHMCPTLKGLQDLDEEAPDKQKEEDGGYCQMWSLFMMEVILMNPRMKTADIIEECFRVSDSNPEYLRRIMRGYVFQMSKEIEAVTGYNIKSGKLKARERSRSRYYQTAIDLAQHHASKRRKTQRGSPDKKIQAEDVDDETMVRWAKVAKKLIKKTPEEIKELYANIGLEGELRTRKDYEMAISKFIHDNGITVDQLLEINEEEDIIDLL